MGLLYFYMVYERCVRVGGRYREHEEAGAWQCAVSMGDIADGRGLVEGGDLVRRVYSVVESVV